MQPKRNVAQGKKSITDDIEKLRQRREDRKIKEDRKGQVGNPGQESNKTMDIEYEKMILKKKNEIFQKEPKYVKFLQILINFLFQHTTSENSKIIVLVRKRPLSKKEISKELSLESLKEELINYSNEDEVEYKTKEIMDIISQEFKNLFVEYISLD